MSSYLLVETPRCQLWATFQITPSQSHKSVKVGYSARWDKRSRWSLFHRVTTSDWNGETAQPLSMETVFNIVMTTSVGGEKKNNTRNVGWEVWVQWKGFNQEWRIEPRHVPPSLRLHFQRRRSLSSPPPELIESHELQSLWVCQSAASLMELFRWRGGGGRKKIIH